MECSDFWILDFYYHPSAVFVCLLKIAVVKNMGISERFPKYRDDNQLKAGKTSSRK